MEQEICPSCPWSIEIREPAIFNMLRFLNLIDSGCPIGRHELRNRDWLLLGILRAERNRIMTIKMQE